MMCVVYQIQSLRDLCDNESGVQPYSFLPVDVYFPIGNNQGGRALLGELMPEHPILRPRNGIEVADDNIVVAHHSVAAPVYLVIASLIIASQSPTNSLQYTLCM